MADRVADRGFQLITDGLQLLGGQSHAAILAEFGNFVVAEREEEFPAIEIVLVAHRLPDAGSHLGLIHNETSAAIELGDDTRAEVHVACDFGLEVHHLRCRFVYPDDGADVLKNLRGEHEHLDERISELSVPTLVVWGEQDEIIPLTIGRRVHELVRGSSLEVIPQCGHLPELEKPGEFVGCLLQFLAR